MKKINCQLEFQTAAALEYGYGVVSPGDTKIRENLLAVKVFFQSLNIRNIEEAVKYDITTSIYAIGGAISLYLGMSISMGFEVLEFIIDCILNVSVNCSKNKNKKSPFYKSP